MDNFHIPIDNPYLWYDNQRKNGSIQKISSSKFLVTGYNCSKFLLEHQSCLHWGQDATILPFMPKKQRAIAKTLYSLSTDSEKPYRKKIIHKLAASNLSIENDHILKLANQVLYACMGENNIEFMSDYANTFTFSTIARIIGIPVTDIPYLGKLIKEMGGNYLNCVDGNRSDKTEIAFVDYLKDFILSKIKRIKILASSLISFSKEEEEEEDFILSLIILLFYAGHENMMNFLGNAIISLHENSFFLENLRSNPNLIKGSINELLRYDSPLQLVVLFNNERVVYENVVIPSGSQILVSIGAANRDPSIFEKPNNLQLGRKINSLSFGIGAFRCIGARLAQLQAEIGLSVFLKRIRKYEINLDNVIWKKDNFVQRGASDIPMRIYWNE